MRTMQFHVPCGTILALSFALAVAPAVAADPPVPTLSSGYKFAEQTGEALYANICQACHMSKGEGAVGAGRYPALAKNEKLMASRYPIEVVLHGQKGMSAFGRMLSDDQVAAVVNYVRTHFGNNYTDAVTPQDVQGARGPAGPVSP
jgi:mono/diheme cytochrome c family protein